MITIEEGKHFSEFYKRMTTSELLKHIAEGINTYCTGGIPQDLSEIQIHFLAAKEMLSRIQINHLGHDHDGRAMITHSDYSMDNLDAAIDWIKENCYEDGEVMAYAPLGKYIAPRKSGTVQWYV